MDLDNMDCEASASTDPKGKRAVSFASTAQAYKDCEALESEDMEDQISNKRPLWNTPENQRRRSSICGFLLGTIVLIVLLGAIAYHYRPAADELLPLHTTKTDQSSSPSCRHPPIRREWRTLTAEERQDFIRSFNCLSRVPSTWGLNGTIYDDFSALHEGIGSWSHRSSSFLPWHRNALHVWETALRTHCGFAGQVPYWDWTMDWMNIANSTIWDGTTGFGGDGQVDGPITVGNGRCVVDGPFTDLQPIKYNHTYVRHCLSRGFRDKDNLGQISGSPFSPEKIGEIKRKPTYVEFEGAIELYLHNTMHVAISGDFLSLTAANDPIFYVHHTQLDHLWWEWQQEDRQRRLSEYGGKHMYNSTTYDAGLDSMLMYGGYTEDVPVSEIINTEGGRLCYRY